MATTKRKIAEQVQSLLNGGVLSDDAKYDIREIEELVGQACNKVLKTEHIKSNIPLGEMIPPHALIATYENITVTSRNDYSCTVTLPAQPINLPRNVGVWNMFSNDEPYITLVPVQSGRMNIFNSAGRRHENAFSCDVIPYEVRSNKKVIIYAPESEIGSTVDLQLLVVDVNELTVNDLLPLASDMEYDVVREVLSLMGQTPPEDMVNDGKTDTVE